MGIQTDIIAVRSRTGLGGTWLRDRTVVEGDEPSRPPGDGEP
ncbi:hypothetical protein [Halosimplex salinum]|nr:hypothetical protein [Halosimplex salinum]